MKVYLQQLVQMGRVRDTIMTNAAMKYVILGQDCPITPRKKEWRSQRKKPLKQKFEKQLINEKMNCL